MTTRILLFIAMHLCCILSLSQERVLVGIIVDKVSLNPLPYAKVSVSKDVYLADEVGRVNVRCEVGQTIEFSHIGYQKAELTVNDTLDYQTLFGVFMSPDTIMLSEVTVKSRQLNLSVMSRTLPISIDINNEIASSNVKLATQTALSRSGIGILDSDDAQKREINKNINRQVNEGFVTNTEVNITEVIAHIATALKKSSEKPKSAIPHISIIEIEELLSRN